ncbi:hypothetical protein ACFV8T_33140 [Streptomyces sp. NPDC059832]|uniref:hypothetical protein n=1 Tax=Streptomyces sp. NPDC059832 TaxID=3346966 RepID=UPI0036592766
MSSSVEEIVPSLIETITRIRSRQWVSITPRSMTSRPGSPNSASWLHGVRCLDTMVLPQLADAVEDETETGTSPAGLPDAPYRAAADAVNNLAAALPRLPAPVGSPSAGSQGTSDTVFLRAVPAWETDALWQVHVALRCARDGEPDAAALGDLLREVGEDCPPPQTADDIVDRLNRVLAVLLLDTSAVRTFATALALNTPQDTHIQTPTNRSTPPGPQPESTHHHCPARPPSMVDPRGQPSARSPTPPTSVPPGRPRERKRSGLAEEIRCRKHNLRAPARRPGVPRVRRGHRTTRKPRLIPGVLWWPPATLKGSSEAVQSVTARPG